MKIEGPDCSRNPWPCPALRDAERLASLDRMKRRTKRILISALAAALLEVGFIGLASMVQQPSDGQDIFTLCLVPFYFIAAVLTHNAEDTSIVLIYLLMFLFLVGITYLTQVIWAQIRRGSHDA